MVTQYGKGVPVDLLNETVLTSEWCSYRCYKGVARRNTDLPRRDNPVESATYLGVALRRSSSCATFDSSDSFWSCVCSLLIALKHRVNISVVALLKQIIQETAMLKQITEWKASLKQIAECKALLKQITEGKASLKQITEWKASLKQITQETALLN